ncbi:MAG: hypothetical protein WA063_06610 [Minisyncoccia bacterium]
MEQIEFALISLLAIISGVIIHLYAEWNRKKGYEQGRTENIGLAMEKKDFMDNYVYPSNQEGQSKSFFIIGHYDKYLEVELERINKRIKSPCSLDNFFVKFSREELEGVEPGLFVLNNQGKLFKI